MSDSKHGSVASPEDQVQKQNEGLSILLTSDVFQVFSLERQSCQHLGNAQPFPRAQSGREALQREGVLLGAPREVPFLFHEAGTP